MIVSAQTTGDKQRVTGNTKKVQRVTSHLSPVAMKGFTLIELLVVIAVIGVLAGAVIAIINPGAQLGRARNAQRKSDLRQVAGALEQYVTINGSYPVSASWCSTNPSGDNWGPCPATALPKLVTQGSLKKLPQDPNAGKPISICSNNPLSVAYLYKSDGVNYKFMAYCGPEGSSAIFSTSDPFYNPDSYATWSWAVYSPGASAWD